MDQNPNEVNEVPFNKNNFHGFTESPFDYDSDLRFFYSAPSRVAILTKILDQQRQDFARILVVGAKATGKTILGQMLTALLDQEGRVRVIYYLPLDFLDRDGSLRLLLNVFGLEWQEGDFEQNFRRLKQLFIYQAQIGKPIFLIIEQNRHTEYFYVNAILYELFNLWFEGRALFHFVWFATTEPPRRPFQVVNPFDDCAPLNNMNFREMVGMIHYRCRVAGRKKPMFTEGAMRLIFRLTDGNPGQTIRLCDFSVLEAVGLRKQICGIDVVQTVWDKWIVPIDSIIKR